MIGWYVPIERKLMEQRSLFDFPMSHRDSQSCFSQQLNQRMSCVATPTFSTVSVQKRPDPMVTQDLLLAQAPGWSRRKRGPTPLGVS